MKNKLVKVSIIFITILLLCGCGWSEVSEYPNFTCVYKADSKGFPTKENNESIIKVTYSKTSTSLKAIYTSSAHNFTGTFITNEGGNFITTHTIGSSSTKVNYQESDFTTVKNTYDTTGKCPTNVWYKGNSSSYSVGFDKCTGNQCYKFTLEDSTSTSDTNDKVYTCKYSVNGVDFRVDMKNINNDYISSSNSRNQVSLDYISTHVIVSYNKNGTYTQVSPTTTINGENFYLLRDDDGTQADRKAFFVKAFNNNVLSCPTLYLKDYNVFTQFVTTDKYNSVDYTENSPIPAGSAVCYDESKQSVDCNSLGDASDVLGDSEVQKTCEYTSNDSTQYYKIIATYDKSKTTLSDRIKLKFNGNGTGLTVVSSQSKDSSDGYQYITNTDILETFNNSVVSDKLNCPAYIYCNCNVNAVNAKNKTCTFLGSGDKNNKVCGTLKSASGQTVSDIVQYQQNLTISQNSLNISDETLTCEEALGENLAKILHLFITGIRIAGAIIAIIKAMMALIPAITSKDADALKKAGKTCVMLAIILCVIGIFPSLIKLLAKIAGFDSCGI